MYIVNTIAKNSSWYQNRATMRPPEGDARKTQVKYNFSPELQRKIVEFQKKHRDKFPSKNRVLEKALAFYFKSFEDSGGVTDGNDFPLKVHDGVRKKQPVGIALKPKGSRSSSAG